MKCFPFLAANEGCGLCPMEASARTFILFACAANQTVDANLFTKYFSKYITQENVKMTDVFQEIKDMVHRKSNGIQRLECVPKLPHDGTLYLNQVTCGMYSLTTDRCQTRKPKVVIRRLKF